MSNSEFDNGPDASKIIPGDGPVGDRPSSGAVADNQTPNPVATDDSQNGNSTPQNTTIPTPAEQTVEERIDSH